VTPAELRAAFPPEGLFAEKDFLLSPRPFLIDGALRAELEKLGHRLFLFQRAANELYHRSLAGKAPVWVAALLDGGKPPELLERARRREARQELPHIIRPDLLLTPDGFAIAELDSVPGGIGLTQWLNATYATAGAWDVLGGPHGMFEAFRAIVPEGRILISRESATYRPEMEYLARLSGGALQVASAEEQREPAPHYRFYELFDLPKLPAEVLLASTPVTPPAKPWLEEKLWFALFWSRPLREYWRRELSERHFLALQKVIPQTWVLDPAPLPPHAVLPGLEIHAWSELAAFSQKQRDFVLKISGFSELGWGSRSVVVGSDVPQAAWAAALERALGDFPHHPWVLQRFAHTRLIEQPYFAEDGTERTMRGRVRLCPYYFILEGRAELRGALATIVPADKKLLHGMSAAILAPAAVA
jgi:hypothetical protein